MLLSCPEMTEVSPSRGALSLSCLLRPRSHLRPRAASWTLWTRSSNTWQDVQGCSPARWGCRSSRTSSRSCSTQILLMVALLPWWGLGALSPTRWGQLQEWGSWTGVSVLQGGTISRRALQAGRQDTCPFHPLGAHSPRCQSPEDSSAVRRLGQHSSQKAREGAQLLVLQPWAQHA